MEAGRDAAEEFVEFISACGQLSVRECRPVGSLQDHAKDFRVPAVGAAVLGLRKVFGVVGEGENLEGERAWIGFVGEEQVERGRPLRL